MSKPAVRDIVREYLRAHGYNGLRTDDCGCREDDLMPCDGPCARCIPGYLLPCCCGDHDWHIGPDPGGRDA